MADRYVCGDCGLRYPKSSVGRDGPRHPTCPSCKGDFRAVKVEAVDGE